MYFFLLSCHCNKKFSKNQVNREIKQSKKTCPLSSPPYLRKLHSHCRVFRDVSLFKIPAKGLQKPGRTRSYQTHHPRSTQGKCACSCVSFLWTEGNGKNHGCTPDCKSNQLSFSLRRSCSVQYV